MRILITLALSASLYAAIPANAIWSIRSDATASNVNGGFFNTENANFPTDGTVDTNTGNTSAPVFSSASYNFVAGDVGAWIYIKSGTNTYPGFYQIASVASNKATLTATVGSGVLFNQTNRTYTASTAAGIASTGTPSSITWGINYAWGTAANNSTTTDLASSIGTTNPCTVTSAGSPFGINHTGNGLRVSAGTNWTQDWYEVVSVSGVTATLDKACGSAASISSGTFRVGGSMSMNSTLDDDLFEKGIAGNDFLVKNGTISLGETVSVAAAGGAQNPIRIIGYNSLPGDNPTGTTRPTINTATSAFAITLGANWDFMYMQVLGSAAAMFTLGSNARVVHARFVNSSTTATRVALTGAADMICVACEAVSYRGRAISVSTNNVIVGSYVHDSGTGIYHNSTSTPLTVLNTIIAANVTYGIQIAAAATGPIIIQNNTIYGMENNVGTGISIATGATDIRLINNIIKGFVTGVSHADSQSVGLDFYNFYHDNTSDSSNWPLASTSVTGTDPAFTSVAQVTDTGATSSGAVLTASGAKDLSGVVAGRDYIYVASGTGVTAGIYDIASVNDGADTVTSNITLGTGSSITWSIVTGRNFAIGTALKALAYPGAFPGALTTGYMDPGAAQRQEAGGGGTRIY